MSQVFQQYILRQQIARKKTSVLYLAHTIDNAEDLCVIKAYDTLDIHEEDEQQQFLQELLVVNELEHHNILPPLNGGIERGYPYIVNTYMPAGSLYQRLQDGAYPSPLEETLALLTTIGDALAYAHAQGRIHGNLKPENILFGPDGVPLLTDFCLPSIDAQFKHSTHFRQLLNARTACYMAPEQFSKKADALSDQYALGCMAYELLSGQPPFQAAALSTWKSMHEHEQPRALSQLVPTLPPELEAVVHKALAKEPSLRHADMTAFVEALVAYSAAEPFNVIVATAHTQTIWDESDAAGLAEELTEINVDGGQAEIRTVAELAEIKADEEQVETVQERELILAAVMSASPIESSAELPLVEPGTQTPLVEPRNGVPGKVAPLVGLTPFLTTMRTLAARPSTSDVPPSRQILTKMTWPLICILCVLIGTSVVLLLLRHQLPAYMSMSRTVTAFSQPAASPGASTATVTVTPVQLQALPTPTVLPTQNGAQIQQFVPPTPTVPANPSVNDGTHGSKHHAGGGGTSHPSPASSPTPTPSPTPEPTVTPTVAATPTATPTVVPTATPTTEPTNTPTPSSEELRWFLKHLKFFWWGW